MNKEDNNKDKTTPIEVEKFLKGVQYPADKEELLKKAETNKAPSNVMGMLKQINDKEYKNPIEVSQEIGSLNDNENIN